MWAPEKFATDYISRWEGKLSMSPNDAGNWSSGKKNIGVLLGSQYGVTGRTLAMYRGVDVAKITPDDIKLITLPVAVRICLALFFDRPNLDNLGWNRVTASVLDFGWGAGPDTAIKLLQNMLDVGQDGKIDQGGQTAKAFAAMCARSEEAAAGAWWAMREQYYEALVERRPSDGVYLSGWDNRSAYFMPGHREGWWGRFGVTA